MRLRPLRQKGRKARLACRRCHRQAQSCRQRPQAQELHFRKQTALCPSHHLCKYRSVPFKIYCPKIGGEMLLRVVACRPMRKAARVFFGSLAHNRGLKPAFAGAWDCGGARTGFDRACIALLEWFAVPEGVAGACIALLVGCVATAGVAGACVALVAWFAALCCGSRHLCVAGACIAL